MILGFGIFGVLLKYVLPLVNENLKAIAEITITNSSFRNEKIDSLISKFELDPVRNIKANLLSGGQKKKLETQPGWFVAI